jgi:hypothetical protein
MPGPLSTTSWPGRPSGPEQRGTGCKSKIESLVLRWRSAGQFAQRSAQGLVLKEFVLALLHRRAWQGPQVTAEGWITGQEIKEHYHKSDSGRGSYTYTHWITFEFPISEGPVRLKAQVDERRYVQLKRGQPVKVRYAQEDPRLAILEWESDW